MVKRLGALSMLVIVLLGSAVPSEAWHDYPGYQRRGVVIVPHVAVPVVPFWVPLYSPPVIVAPPPNAPPPPPAGLALAPAAGRLPRR
jgi:hypothetical protein